MREMLNQNLCLTMIRFMLPKPTQVNGHHEHISGKHQTLTLCDGVVLAFRPNDKWCVVPCSERQNFVTKFIFRSNAIQGVVFPFLVF